MKNPKTLMVQGTTSDAGKSVLVAALCRILARHGRQVAPFKPQNMALNSAVTVDGGEIGRAQAVQAQACYLEPSTLMNPVLLKPNTDIGAQVIVHGKAVGNMDASDYHGHKPNLLGEVMWAHEKLHEQYEYVIVEGAGSPAEINLRDRDIANMGFAEEADCPVIIVADIDRGGVFAHLVGTYELLSESEQQRVKGFVINRFRGDVNLLLPGNDWLEEKLGIPVLAVIPYIDNLHIEAEDAIRTQQIDTKEKLLRIVVPVLPRISNHTDFDVLRLHPQVDLAFIKDPARFTGADLIILPGTKNVRQDYQWLEQSGWKSIIEKHLRYGGKLLGVCGGFQMLGKTVHDPEGVESQPGSTNMLGYLDMETTLEKEKALRQVSGKLANGEASVKGYEIHAGHSCGEGLHSPFFTLKAQGSDEPFNDGFFDADEQIAGTYVHGLFDNEDIQQLILSWIDADVSKTVDYHALQEAEINRLADVVEGVLPFQRILDLMQG